MSIQDIVFELEAQGYEVVKNDNATCVFDDNIKPFVTNIADKYLEVYNNTDGTAYFKTYIPLVNYYHPGNNINTNFKFEKCCYLSSRYNKIYYDGYGYNFYS